uniref:Uncharacterized protein n=1 Tax=Siphoviridae sp. ctouo22 TaxID=2826463 RepID=A0A8S5MRH9_9CAUD|nr:MAG TPA: hypothetical protein [Siphoviridae sp. ctouo22]
MQTVAPTGKLLLSAQSEKSLLPITISFSSVFVVPSAKVISTISITCSPSCNFSLKMFDALIKWIHPLHIK